MLLYLTQKALGVILPLAGLDLHSTLVVSRKGLGAHNNMTAATAQLHAGGIPMLNVET
jgi:hypothetical protein